MIYLYVGPIDTITNWFKEQFTALWNAFKDFLGDMVTTVVQGVMHLFLAALNAIGVPDFLTTYNLGTLLGQAGPTIIWLAGVMRLGECLLVISAGVAFRLLRKLLTLGQW